MFVLMLTSSSLHSSSNGVSEPTEERATLLLLFAGILAGVRHVELI